MQDRPTAAELLDAVATFLTEDVMAELDARKSFHVRVAANVLRILEREWLDEPAHREEDRVVMAALLGRDGAAQDLSDELAHRIRAGEFDDRADEVLAALRGITRRKLSITNPRYIRD